MLFDLIRVHIVAILFLLHCAGLGHALLQPLSLWEPPGVPSSNRYLKWFFAISIGCLANILALFLLGLVGFFTYAAVLGAGTALLLAALPCTAKHTRALHISNSLIPTYGSKLVQLGFENAMYFFDGTVIGDWFRPGRYGSMLDCRAGECKRLDAGRMKERMNTFGGRMLV